MSSNYLKYKAYIIIIILIIAIIGVLFHQHKEKYINPNDTNISIINFNCSAKSSVPLNTISPDSYCTTGDDPICLDHLLFRSTPQYI